MKKQFNFQKRPLSWSAISSFLYDKEQWYKRYELGEKTPETKEMIFGKILGKSIELGKSKTEYLIDVPRASKMEHPFRVNFSGIELIGYADSFCDKTFKELHEFKTGKKAWDQKRVDEHGQIDMYLLMNYITNKVSPEEVACFLHWIPTTENGAFEIELVKPVKVRTFKTKRTMKDILKFGVKIKEIVKEMEEYAESKLSTCDKK